MFLNEIKCLTSGTLYLHGDLSLAVERTQVCQICCEDETDTHTRKSVDQC